jgi:5-methylcytosine-specific restriction endonuclease McrA
MLGGRCVRCGSTEDLEFDHIDPTTKWFPVGAGMSRAWDVLVEEALKCQLLCPPCHREKGAKDRVPNPFTATTVAGTTAVAVQSVDEPMPTRVPGCERNG